MLLIMVKRSLASPLEVLLIIFSLLDANTRFFFRSTPCSPFAVTGVSKVHGFGVQVCLWDWRNSKQVACLEESHMDDVTQVCVSL